MDHNAFQWILRMADDTGKLARWRLPLSEFDSEVVHQARIEHQAANESPLKDDVPILAVTET